MGHYDLDILEKIMVWFILCYLKNIKLLIICYSFLLCETLMVAKDIFEYLKWKKWNFGNCVMNTLNKNCSNIFYNIFLKKYYITYFVTGNREIYITYIFLCYQLQNSTANSGGLICNNSWGNHAWYYNT